MMRLCGNTSLTKMKSLLITITISCLQILFVASQETSLPCNKRLIGESFVCVCNSSYCDSISKFNGLGDNRYVAYVTSQAGETFEVLTGGPDSVDESRSDFTINIDPKILYQKIIGFGGAITDAAGINIKSVTSDVQKNIINSYFSDNGLEYNMIRVPIGGSDFSTHTYAYNEFPKNDVKLSNFSLAFEDINYKIPAIEEALKVTSNEIYLIGSCWSPPVWMKTNNNYGGLSRLKQKYYQTYADYHIKFLEEYDKQGIKFWGITTGNEPMNGVVPFNQFNSLGWLPSTQAEWLAKNLGPTVRNSRFKDTKIMGPDDQRYILPMWLNLMKSANNKSLDYLDGIAVHWYADFTPGGLLSLTHEAYPDKFIIGTEACEGSQPWVSEKVKLGAWSRAQSYILDILQDLNNFASSWVDWNIALDRRGGPNWIKNFVDAPIIVIREKDEFYKQPMYYAMGHFSKFLPRDSQRIYSQGSGGIFSEIYYTSFLRPDNIIATIIYNGSQRDKFVKVVNESGTAKYNIKVPKKGIVSVLSQNN